MRYLKLNCCSYINFLNSGIESTTSIQPDLYAECQPTLGYTFSMVRVLTIGTMNFRMPLLWHSAFISAGERFIEKHGTAMVSSFLKVDSPQAEFINTFSITPFFGFWKRQSLALCLITEMMIFPFGDKMNSGNATPKVS